MKKKLSNNHILVKKHVSNLTKFKAFVTDLFMITTPIIYIVIYLIFQSKEMFEQNMLIGWICILIPNYIITTLFLIIKGQTPGLKAYEIKLIDKNTKDNIGFLQATLRYILFILSIILILFPLLPIIRKDNQTIQDLLSSTIIINFPNKK